MRGFSSMGFGLHHGGGGGGSLPPSPSDIISLTVQAATALDPDGSGHGVNGNGWVAKVVVPYQAGQTFDPSKLSLSVSDPGFNSDGSATTRARTISGTVRLRRQYPNQASYQEAQVGANLEVYVCFDDSIYLGTTIVAASVAAGYYGTSASGSVPVTNNSTLAYPKPLFGWLNKQHERATASGFSVEALVYHRHAMNGQQVACVEFYAKDAQATPNVSATQRSAAPALSAIQTQGQIVEAWKATIPLTSLTQGDVCAAWATVKPWIGDAWDLETNEFSATLDANPQIRLRFKNDKTGAYGGAIACVQVGASGGAVAEDIATATSTPYPNLDAAFAAIAAYNSASKGHNDLGGGTIYLMDYLSADTYWRLSGNVTAAAGDCWLEVKRHPNNVADAYYDQNSVQRTVPSLVNWRVNVKKPGTAGVFTCGESLQGSVLMMASEDSTVDLAAGTTTPWLRQCGLIYQRNVTYISAGGSNVPALGNETTSGIRCALALGVIFQPTTLPCNLYPYLVAGCSGRFYLADPTTSWQTSNDGVIVANTIFSRNQTTIGLGALWSIARGMAIVQNVFETIAANPTTWSGDSMVLPVDNLIFTHNTLPDDPIDATANVGRCNHLYADVDGAVNVSKRGIWRFNLCGRWAVKSDSFTTNSILTGRVGNWERSHGVGCVGNTMSYTRPISNDNSLWGGEWRDPLSQDAQTYSFVNNQVSVGGAGGGDYHLNGASNGAYNRVPAGLAALKYDLSGVARHNDGTGANGAYERTV